MYLSCKWTKTPSKWVETGKVTHSTVNHKSHLIGLISPALHVLGLRPARRWFVCALRPLKIIFLDVFCCLMQLRQCDVLLALAVAAKDRSCRQGGSPWSWETHCPLCWVLRELVLGASCGWREVVEVAELEGLRAWCTFWGTFFWSEVKMFAMK